MKFLKSEVNSWKCCQKAMKFLKSEVSSWKKGNEVLEKFKSEMTFEDWNLLSLYTRTWT